MKKQRKKKEETTGQKYNGLPLSIERPQLNWSKLLFFTEARVVKTTGAAASVASNVATAMVKAGRFLRHSVDGDPAPPKFSAHVYYSYCDFVRTLHNRYWFAQVQVLFLEKSLMVLSMCQYKY